MNSKGLWLCFALYLATYGPTLWNRSRKTAHLYLGSFEFVYRRQEQALLANLFETTLAPNQRLMADNCPAA